MSNLPKSIILRTKWLGEIPLNWNVKKIKYFTSSKNNKSINGDEELLSVSEYKGVVPRSQLTEDDDGLSRAESLVGYLKVEKGYLVANIMLMWKKGLGVSRHKGIVSPAYSVFSFLDSNPFYFDYLFRTNLYITEFRKHSTGIIDSRLRLYDDKFKALYTHFPPIEEQNLIVKYLDKKLQPINQIIENIDKKVELLKKQRNSLINEVFSRGLNPNVEMKDSKIEWLGKIPSHWNVSKLKYIADANQENLTNSTDSNFELDYIEISDVNEIGLIKTPTKYLVLLLCALHIFFLLELKSCYVNTFFLPVTNSVINDSLYSLKSFDFFISTSIV